MRNLGASTLRSLLELGEPSDMEDSITREVSLACLLGLISRLVSFLRWILSTSMVASLRSFKLPGYANRLLLTYRRYVAH